MDEKTKSSIAMVVIEGGDGKLFQEIRELHKELELEKVNFHGAIETLRHLSPEIVIFDLDHQTEEIHEILSASIQELPGTYWVISSEKMTSDDLVALMRLGVSDVLIQPVKEKELQSLIQRFNDRNEKKTQDRIQELRRVISVYSSKGGVGTSFTAVNLAVAMAKKSPAKVLIADFVLQHGNVAEFLDISPQHTLLDLIENLERLDTKLLENTIHKHRSEVFVLPCPKKPEESEFFTAKETSEILKTLRSGFQYTFLDIGHELNATTISCLDLSDLILLVTTPDIPSLCNTKAILQTFKKLGYTEDKVKLILNRWHMKGEIDASLVEKNISYAVFHKLEEDASLVINSLNQGIPISELSKNAGLVKSFDKLAKLVSETLKKGGLAHVAPRTVKANGS